MQKQSRFSCFVFGILVLLLCSCQGRAETATPAPAAAASPVMPTDTPTQPPTRTPTTLPTETLVPTLGIGSRWTSPVDGMSMAYVPEGDFPMGTEAFDSDDEQPVHVVKLSAFWIDLTEVTNAMYTKCVQARVCAAPASTASYSYTSYFDNPKFADFPVIFVSWVDARDYCAWAGERLPTEAEWEKAARGTDGRTYPWGNASPNCSLVNFTTNGRTCTGDPAQAGSYPSGASPYGVLDMSGNVMEWVHDTWDPLYYGRSPEVDPQGSDKTDYRVVRGGSWYTSGKGVRSTNRDYENPYNVYDTLGFRCVRSAGP